MIRPRIHAAADVEEGALIGEGTAIWHQAHVRSSAVIGDGCVVGKGVYVDAEVRVGDRCKIQNGANLYRGLVVADDVFIGPDVQFTNDRAPRAWLWDDDRLERTEVQRGASIGANATIICGLTIGEYAMVAAGSVVVKDVPAHGLVMGSPARLKGFVTKDGERLRSGRRQGEVVLIEVAPGEHAEIPAGTADEVGL